MGTWCRGAGAATRCGSRGRHFFDALERVHCTDARFGVQAGMSPGLVLEQAGCCGRMPTPAKLAQLHTMCNMRAS